ncbi:MAG TPA: type ISP restriction/modification enzyme, partial [Verrucomicrobiae bacterium]|nr:type ISP restriction/modification enzyme [Verrucomicrobiae bacterium]
QRRKRHGVFYTPPALVRHVVRNVDKVLREEFYLTDGLLDETTWQTALERGDVAVLPDGVAGTDPLIRIIDPALGAGLFLTEIILAARRSVPDVDQWNEVAPRLLARLGGIEILPAAAVIALVRLAATLHATGYCFASAAKIDLRLGDALASPMRPPWTVIIGNPPFSGISSTKHDWVHALLRGRGPAGEPRANYFEFAGAPLAERKHWLQDDYVKFLRVAHEQIETAGLGIVALVTSHGYLDNITFRALREKLSATFARISLLDLHGNAKRRERAPDGGRDENVFGIESGVAIGIFRKPPGEVATAIERGDVWGMRAAKLAALDGADVGTLQPITTGSAVRDASFHIHIKTRFAEYEAGWSIDKAMPVNSTAPVTARDAFVVADTMEELAQRAQDFCNPAISDEVIRARYFTRTRSRSYAAGDTRGWKLADARRRMQTLDWRTLVQRVQYRPCDERVMLWADWLIDWPRTEVTSHLLAGENLALITRRQAPPNQPWTYVWITDKLALDGVIRSDNRGSESLFPLWLYDRDGRRANFAAEFVSAFAHVADDEVDTNRLLHYIYGLLHSRRYRDRYQQALVADFPRILIPRSRQLFERVAQVGRRLAVDHRMPKTPRAVQYCGRLPTSVDAGFPRHVGRRL